MNRGRIVPYNYMVFPQKMKITEHEFIDHANVHIGSKLDKKLGVRPTNRLDRNALFSFEQLYLAPCLRIF